ncbi:hypothetical protein CBL_07184 [Carabus blaptoides fortunei]
MQYQIAFVLLALLLSVVTGQNKKTENEPCTFSEECKIGLECRENVCRCPEGKKLTSETGTSANCAPVLGLSCEGHDDCEAMKGAQCGEAKCYCPIGVGADSKECIQTLASIQDKCTVHTQCIHLIGDYAQCKNDRCSCKVRYYYDEENNKCEKAKGLSEKCQKNVECYLNYDDALACKDNTCQCAEGFKLVHDSCESGATVVLVSIATIFTAIVTLRLW